MTFVIKWGDEFLLFLQVPQNKWRMAPKWKKKVCDFPGFIYLPIIMSSFSYYNRPFTCHSCLVEDKAAQSLLNKMIHTSLVNTTNQVEVLQRDPNSPLYSVKTFEELRL